MKKEATRKNGVAKHSEIREEIEGVNKDMSEISFFTQGITKCN